MVQWRRMSELYKNAVCLAPMVRAGTLPLRLLSLRYGADLVYSEEIIDKRIVATTRVENPILNTVDYVSKNNSVVFQTCAEEKGKIIFQIGTADPMYALKAAQHVEQDVAAIDINMGCPKHFSIQGGMGAALLKKQDIACEIVRTLSQNLSIPVSCKIRLLQDTQATISFAKALIDAGAVAIGLHVRHVDERPIDKAHWEELTPIVQALAPIPVLANGDIYTYEDMMKCSKLSGVSSFLIARGALSNVSVFRKEQGLLPSHQVIQEYLRIAAEWDNVYQNTKYNLTRMLPGKLHESPCDNKDITVGHVCATKNASELYALWGMEQEYRTYQSKIQARIKELGVDTLEQTPERVYDDAYLLNQQFYCSICQLQLLSDADMAIHVKGKKHTRKARGSENAVRTQQIQQTLEVEEPERKRNKVEII